MCAKLTYWLVFIISIFFFFFNDTATTEIYTLSLHDALPISPTPFTPSGFTWGSCSSTKATSIRGGASRSEEHTSELQSLAYLVCRLLLEKKKKHILNPLLRTKKKTIKK